MQLKEHIEGNRTDASPMENGVGTSRERGSRERQVTEERPRDKNTVNYPNQQGISCYSKLDFSKLSYEDLMSWLFRVEQLFDFDDVALNKRVRLAAVFFEGEAIQWHQSFMRVGLGLPKIEVRFDPLSVDEETCVGNRVVPTLFGFTVNILEATSIEGQNASVVTDYTLKMTSWKEYRANRDEPYKFVTVREFRSFHIRQQKIRDELGVLFDKSKSHPAALTTQSYGVSKACSAREFLLMKRNSFIYNISKN